jgi:GTPase SAR1 family protein
MSMTEREIVGSNNLQTPKFKDFKVLVVSDESGVGKTTLVNKWIYDGVCESKPDSPYRMAKVCIHDSGFAVQLWDCTVKDAPAYKGINAVILIFDITRRSSFDSLSSSILAIKKYSSDLVPIALVGNKTDLRASCPSSVTFAEANEAAKIFQIPYFETAMGKDDENALVFVELLEHSVLHDRANQQRWSSWVMGLN